MFAKIFISGNSQAVRLPKEVAFPSDITEVVIEKTATGGLILKPHKNFDWELFFNQAEADPLDIQIPKDEKPDTERQDKVRELLNGELDRE